MVSSLQRKPRKLCSLLTSFCDVNHFLHNLTNSSSSTNVRLLTVGTIYTFGLLQTFFLGTQQENVEGNLVLTTGLKT